MRLDEINRRGFMRGVAATAASTVLPKKEILAAIDTFVKDVGGVDNLKILNKLLETFDIYDIDRFRDYAVGNTSFEEVLTDDEADDLADKIRTLGYVPDDDGFGDDNQTVINDYFNDNEFHGNIYDAASELIERPIQYEEALGIIHKGGSDPDTFFSHSDGVGDVIKKAFNDARKQYMDLNPSGLVNTAKEMSLPIRQIRIAGLIASVIQKVMGNVGATTAPAPTEIPQQTRTSQVPALPAPSDDGNLDDLSNIDRMKNLAGIRRQ